MRRGLSKHKNHISHISNPRKVADSLGKKLGIKTHSEWYGVTHTNLSESIRKTLNLPQGTLNGGKQLWISDLLETAYPEFIWLPWKFALPKQYWDKKENLRKAFDALAIELGIHSQQDWYSVSLQQDDIIHWRLIAPYNRSVVRALSDVYPQYEWHPWKFSYTNRGFWGEKKEQRMYLDWLADELNIETQHGFYELTTSDIVNTGGTRVLNLNNGSLLSLFQNTYEEFQWYPWAFANIGKTWSDPDNIRKYFDWLAEQHGIHTFEEWHEVSSEDLRECSPKSLLDHVPSIFKGLRMAYPQIDWNICNFEREVEDLKKYFEQLAVEFGIKELDDWYQIKFSSVKNRYYDAIDRCGISSAAMALQLIYPEHDWKLWLFEKVPQHWWEQLQNQRQFMDWVADKLSIQRTEDWFLLKSQQIDELGGNVMLNNYYNGSLLQALQTIYPQFTWTAPSKPLSVPQQKIYSLLKNVFPDEDIELNYRHPVLTHSHSAKNMELDFYIPSLKLALEYQGEQHYSLSHRGSFEDQQKRDQEKRESCKKIGIDLIEIPYWWDNTPESILLTIHAHRPDLQVKSLLSPEQLESAAVIPMHPPKRNTTNSSAFIVTSKWNGRDGVKGWWISNKVDGLAAHWDGQQLYTNEGKLIPVPVQIKQLFPSTALHGFLRMRNEQSKEWKKNLMKDVSAFEWDKLSFVILDAPKFTELDYKERMQHVRNTLLSKDNNFLSVLESTLCTGEEHFHQILAANITQGNSNLILHNHTSQQAHILEVKPPHIDYALVVHHMDGEYPSVICINTVGIEFALLGVQQSVHSLRLGSVVSYQYYEMTSDRQIIRPYIHQTHQDTLWEAVPLYHLSYGLAYGETPTCRGCDSKIPRNSLRIQVPGIYFRPTPRHVQYSFCVNVECFLKAEKKAAKNNRILYPSIRTHRNISCSAVESKMSPQDNAKLKQLMHALTL